MKKIITRLVIAIIFVWSQQAFAQNWEPSVRLESINGTGGYVGTFSSMLVVNGNPAVACYDATHTALLYVRSTDVSGTSWGAPVGIDVSGDVGRYTSMIIVDGNPAISYYDQKNGDLKYIRATDASGSTWGTPVKVDVAGNVGQFTSLQVVDGNPAISYYDITNGDLKYVRAADVSGTAWGTPITVATIGDVGINTTLRVANGNPAISYHDATSNKLKYIRATDASGATWAPAYILSNGGFESSMQIINGNPAIAFGPGLQYVSASDASGATWNSPITIEGSAGGYPSLQVVNGNPAIAHQIVFNGFIANDLKYVRANDASGSSWGPSTVIDAPGMSGYYNSLQVVNGNPAIAHWEAAPGNNMKYMRADDATGASWTTSSSVDVSLATYDYASILLVSNNPAVAYFDVTNGDLKYVRANNTSGTSWGTPIAVDVDWNVGLYTSMQMVNGNPAISYFDQTFNKLKYVRANDPLGTSWGAPIIVDAVYGQYTSLKVVDGNPAIAYHDQINGHLKYVRANDASGTTWSTPIILATGSAGQNPSLQVVNGNPAISYYDGENGRLNYIRATNAEGTAWATSIAVDGDNCGQYTSLQIVNGNPAISYYDYSGQDLKYVRATDVSGDAWGTPLFVEMTGDVGKYSSMQIINGNPAILFYDQSTYAQKYVRASDISGTTWNPSVQLESNTYSGTYSSMISIGTGAGIAYYNALESLPVFVLGIAPCIAPTVPTLGTTQSAICSGSGTTVTLSITAGTLNDATAWQWYSTSCGGTAVGSGTSVNVNPTGTTTYYARGEGGCVTPSVCASITVTVNSLPTVTLGIFSDVCVDAAAFTLTGGSPASGTFSGTGVNSGNFNPATAGVGAHTITYSYTDGNSCSNSATTDIEVNALPVVTLSDFNALCVDAATLALTGGSPASGTFSGTGVNSGDFNPATAGVGAHTITYSYTDGNSCSNSATTDIEVNALPTVTLSSFDALCMNASAITLTGGSPATGIYSGAGVGIANQGVVPDYEFDPAIGVGTHTITYSYTDGNSCTNTATSDIVVNAVPTVTLSDFNALCANAAALTLTGGSPATGTYTGTGVSSGEFNAATAGAGTHTITYSYTDGNSCSNSATKDIVVNALPTVTLSSFTAICSDASALTLTGGSPASGTYSGTGVSGGSFTPANAGSGTHTITYSYTDANSCSNSATSNIVVNVCTGIEKAISSNGFAVYPNPNNGNATIVSPVTEGTLEIYNASGVLMHIQKMSVGTSDLDLQQFNQGVYTFRLENAAGISVVKVIIQ